MLSRLNSYINLLLKSRLIAKNINKFQRGADAQRPLTIYALCWHTLPGAASYRAGQKNVVWAPFYPRIRVNGNAVEIGKFKAMAARWLALLWRFALPKSTPILTSKRIHGLPRPNNMRSLGFDKKSTLFMKAPSEGIGRPHVGDAALDECEALFLLHDYIPDRDARLSFIATQARRYPNAHILVTKPDTNLAALRQHLKREKCRATVVALSDLMAETPSRMGIGQMLATVYRYTLRPVFFVIAYPFRLMAQLYRKWPVYYRKIISTMPTSAVRHLPGPTVDLDEHMLKWSENVELLMDGVPVSLVHSHDLISAPAGAALARKTGAFHVVDVNEFPMLKLRVGQVFKRMNRRMRNRLEGRIKTALQEANCAIAVSLGVARITGRYYGTPTLPVRNFRDYEPFSDSSMRIDWNIPDGDVALVHACTISPDYQSDLLVEVLAKLPVNYHLVLVGGTVSQDYEDGLVRRANDLGIGARLHIKGEINNPHNYLSYVAGAELGIVLLTPEVPLIRFGLANRHADLIAAGLPIVSTYTIESSRILRMTGNGEIVHSLDPAAMADTIVKMRENPEKWAVVNSRAAYARHEFTWEKETQRYPNPIAQNEAPLDGAKPIAALLFQRGLIRNKRILRLGQVLRARGYRVVYLARALPTKTVMASQPDALFLRVPAVATYNSLLLKTTRSNLHDWMRQADQPLAATSKDS